LGTKNSLAYLYKGEKIIMKILFTTDIHGHKRKYSLLLKALKEDDYDLLIIGGDILPKGKITIEGRRKFLQQNIPNFFKKVNVPIIIDFGNDDLMMLYREFLQIVNSFDYVYTSHLKEVIIKDISIIGMNFVPDYPFGLKDWCRREEDLRYVQEVYIQSPVTTENGVIEIVSPEFFTERESIKENLDSLPEPIRKTIYNIHCPPRGIGLDICRGGKFEAGSYDVTEFILEREPLLTIHGHIHESPQYSGIVINSLNNWKTISIQPGQDGKQQALVYCEFDTDDVLNTFKHLRRIK